MNWVSEHRVRIRGTAFHPGAFALLSAYVGSVVWFSWPTLVSLHGRWTDFGYSHGYVVLLLAAMLAYRELQKGAFRTDRVPPAALVALAVAALGVFAAHAASVTLAAELLLPIFWIFALLAVAGVANTRRFIVPISFLYFAIPIWDLLNGLLQRLTVIVVSSWVRIAGIPAYIEGNYIQIPSGTFEIEGGCSGLHAFVVGLALAVLAGVLHHDRWKSRLLLMFMGIALSLLANWIRVFAVVVAGHLTDMQHFLIVTDHYYFGWALFSLFMVPLFVLDWRLQTPAQPARHASVPPLSADWSRAGAVSVAIAMLVILAAAFLQLRVFGTSIEEAPRRLAPPMVPSWRTVREWTGPTVPRFDGVDGSFAAWYARGEANVGAYIGFYAVQRQRHEVIYFDNRPEGSSNVVARKAVSPSTTFGTRNPFTELLLEDVGGKNRLAWVGMRVGGADVSSAFGAKARQVAGVLSGRRDAQVLILTAECIPACEDARRALEDYANAAQGVLYESILR